MAFNNLPKINTRKHQSHEMQTELELKFRRLISQFEKEKNYEFKAYEIDNMLLNIIKKNHEAYIRNDFGSDTIF